MKRVAKICAAVVLCAVAITVALFVNVWYFKPVTIEAQFHNAVLTHGSLPLIVLERVIDEWIAGVKAT